MSRRESLAEAVREPLRNLLPARASGVITHLPGINGWLDRRAPREPTVEDFLRHHVEAGWHVADVGAHYGRYTRLLADRVGSHGLVTAFEANPRTARGLRRSLGCRQNVLVENLAVTDGVQSNVEIFSGFGGRSATWNIIGTAANGMPAARQGVVQAVALDSYLRDRRFDFAKIDVEGAEEMVLDGMQNLLSHQRPMLLIETHGIFAERGCRERLTEHRYRVETLDVNHLLAVAE